MKALTKVLAGGVVAAALFSAAPAAAQYYPGYPYGGGYGGNIIGQVIGQVLGGGLGGYGGYGSGYGGYGGVNSQAAVNQCASAVQARLSGGGYGYSPYGYGGGYNSYGYGGARVLGISRVEPRSSGGLTVRGVASSGMNVGYANGGQQPIDLTWKCRIDYRGMITDIDVDRAQVNYGSNYQYQQYQQYNPYAAYGYRRY